MAQTQPIQVGVTGGIGAGKSIVCRIFACLGVPIYEADQRARWLTTHDLAIRREVTELLGTDAYTPAGEYNRSYVASRVFSEPLLLQKLNQIIHPRVHQDTALWLSQMQSHPYVIKEAALMNKAGDQNTLDFVVVVAAPLELRISRVQNRDSWRTLEDIKGIIESQMSDDDRLKLADFTVINDETTPLIRQVLDLHQLFIKKSEQR